jgi:hypothetical protein
MKNYRVKVRDDKAQFFEELMRYLDFLDFEVVEGFSEPRIYSGFEINAREKKAQGASKNHKQEKPAMDAISGFGNIREVMERIEAMRDKSHHKK